MQSQYTNETDIEKEMNEVSIYVENEWWKWNLNLIRTLPALNSPVWLLSTCSQTYERAIWSYPSLSFCLSRAEAMIGQFCHFCVIKVSCEYVEKVSYVLCRSKYVFHHPPRKSYCPTQDGTIVTEGPRFYECLPQEREM